MNNNKKRCSSVFQCAKKASHLSVNKGSFEKTVMFSDETFKAYVDALQGVDVEPMPDAKVFEHEVGLKTSD